MASKGFDNTERTLLFQICPEEACSPSSAPATWSPSWSNTFFTSAWTSIQFSELTFAHREVCRPFSDTCGWPWTVSQLLVAKVQSKTRWNQDILAQSPEWTWSVSALQGLYQGRVLRQLRCGGCTVTASSSDQNKCAPSGNPNICFAPKQCHAWFFCSKSWADAWAALKKMVLAMKSL